MELGLYTVMGAKEVKQFLAAIAARWGYAFDAERKYGYLLSKKNKVHLINRDAVAHLEPGLGQLHIDRPGLYFAKITPGGVRLSIEGSQLVGPGATKNVIFVDDRECFLWLKGELLEKTVSETGFVIIAHKKGRIDFLGCGKVHADQKKIANYIPKTRTVLRNE